MLESLKESGENVEVMGAGFLWKMEMGKCGAIVAKELDELVGGVEVEFDVRLAGFRW